jgi:hypothetical protein
MDIGLGLRFSEQDRGIDYLQLAWVRSDLLFSKRSRNYGFSRVRKPRDLLELQVQAPLLENLGKTTMKVYYQLPSDVLFVEDGREEKYKHFSAWLLHSYEIDERNRLFFEYEYGTADEQVYPLIPVTAIDAFDGDRNMNRARVEYQQNLDDSGVRMWRAGLQYLYFHEDEYLPNQVSETHDILRRETALYGGYRFPWGDSKDLSVEPLVYLSAINNHNRWPADPTEDGTDSEFQGKLACGFLWRINDNAEFLLSPSIELDAIGWAGGLIQLRCNW